MPVLRSFCGLWEFLGQLGLLHVYEARSEGFKLLKRCFFGIVFHKFISGFLHISKRCPDGLNIVFALARLSLCRASVYALQSCVSPSFESLPIK